MLRSQIKLTLYDFSDLHITGEFDNRPGTRRFLRIFFCVVTYCTGAGRRLYMKTSADAWPGTVRRRTVPGQCCKRSTGHCTVPGQFSRAMMNICISKFVNIPPKKQFVKIRKIAADSDSDGDGDEKHTCSKLQKKIHSTCLLHVNHPQLLKQYIYILVFMFFGL